VHPDRETGTEPLPGQGERAPCKRGPACAGPLCLNEYTSCAGRTTLHLPRLFAGAGRAEGCWPHRRWGSLSASRSRDRHRALARTRRTRPMQKRPGLRRTSLVERIPIVCWPNNPSHPAPFCWRGASRRLMAPPQVVIRRPSLRLRLPGASVRVRVRRLRSLPKPPAAREPPLLPVPARA